MTEPRTCAWCGVEIGHLRADAIYCGDSCRFKSYLDRNPEARRERAQRLATARSGNPGRSTRTGAHGEHGVRIYFTPADLDELRTLIADASARLTRKVQDASERIEPGRRP